MKYTSKKDAKKAMKKHLRSLDPAGTRKITCTKSGIIIEFYPLHVQYQKLNKLEKNM